MPRNPTKKQKKFAQAVADGANYTQAYRDAYDAEGSSPQTARVNAHRVANNANVRPMIDELKAQNERGLQRNLGFRRRWILERLLAEAESLESTAASRVKSLELLAKMAGMFDSERDRAEKREHATEGELIAELNQRLASVINNPIDISPVDTDSSNAIVESSDTDSFDNHNAIVETHEDDGTPRESKEDGDEDPTPL